MFLLISKIMIYSFSAIGFMYVLGLIFERIYAFKKAYAKNVCAIIMAGDAENAEFLAKYFVSALSGIRVLKQQIIMVTSGENDEVSTIFSHMETDYDMIKAVSKENVEEYVKENILLNLN